MDDSDSLGDKYTRKFTRKKFEQSKADSDANKRWLTSFTQADLDFVNSQLDEELIVSLENTKATVLEISEKVGVAKATSLKINEARETYRPVAARGSLIFFLKWLRTLGLPLLSSEAF